MASKGKPMSEETKAKMSASTKEYYANPENRLKASEVGKNIFQTLKIAQSNRKDCLVKN